MHLNDDFKRPAVVKFKDSQWILSPEVGVNRQLLHRTGEEKAIATTIVEYLPGSHFPTHKHLKGEEFFVLEGTFSDESGDYPKGSYVRNPDGSSHAPYSEKGTVILVKLRQFQDGDDRQFDVSSEGPGWENTNNPRVSILPLHKFKGETASLLKIRPEGAWSAPSDHKGLEIFVYEGSFSTSDFGNGDKWDWFRVPMGQPFSLVSANGAQILVKTGHFLEE